MGCNFYFYPGTSHKVTCYECGHTHKCKDKIHIGKSSIGRYFTLHDAYVEGLPERLDSLKKWMAYIDSFEKGVIRDEYGKKIKREALIKTITREDYPAMKDKWVKGEAANGYGDVFGEKGLVYSRGSRIGEDGLYILLDADFS